MPAAEVIVAPYAAEEWPRAVVPPCGPLPPVIVGNDYMGDLRVCGDPPVGGRISLFVDKWQEVTVDTFVLSVIKNGFQISVQNHFPGVIRKVTVTPQDPEVILRIQEEIRDLVSKNAIVQINDLPSLCLSPDFRYPQKVWGSSSYFEPQGVQSVHFHSALQDGDPECDSTTAVSKRLGCFNRFEGCLPSRSDPSVIQEVSGLSVHGQDLSVQGSAVRPQGFALGVYESGGHSCGPSSSIGSSSLLLSGRLASRSRIQGPVGVPSSYDLAVDSGPRVSSELGEVFPYPAETSRLISGRN